MLTKEGPKVVGYKNGFGSAAAQALFPLFSQGTDLAEIMLACTQGRLKGTDLKCESEKTSVMVYVFGEMMPEILGSSPLERPVEKLGFTSRSFPSNSRSMLTFMTRQRTSRIL
jgi:phosphoribosylamine--glycine ligase/phosphoribosylformylglycinamidine cyclo-ligase